MDALLLSWPYLSIYLPTYLPGWLAGWLADLMGAIGQRRGMERDKVEPTSGCRLHSLKLIFSFTQPVEIITADTGAKGIAVAILNCYYSHLRVPSQKFTTS